MQLGCGRSLPAFGAPRYLARSDACPRPGIPLTPAEDARGSSDHELLDRLRAGSRDAFDAIFRQHYAPLVAVAGGIVHDRASAEDVVQDVMLELWRRRAALAIETTLRSYLFRATRNRALNRIRDEQVARRAEPLLAHETGVGSATDRRVHEQEIAGAVRRAVAELPARCREVFELSRVHGLKYAEIANVMNISIKTVEAQMGKALRVIRERLAPWLPQGGGW
jgi:RNA polymerase sigma-70 factor, ECF subfamily